MKPRRHTRRDRSGILLAVALLGALAAPPAHSSGGVSCNLAATSLAFGHYVPSSGTPDDVTATITVTCTATGSSTVPLLGAISLTGVSTSDGRHLTSGVHIVRYHTFLDPARTMFWGDGTGRGGTAVVSAMVGPSAPFRQTYIVYGRILARQSATPVGAYADRITAVLNY